jgi:hypothetical protein
MSKELPKISARFSAKYLHALCAILDAAQDRAAFSSAGLYIEPAQPGVLIVATTGTVIAVLRDLEGHANKPFKVNLPKFFRERCAPAKPVAMFDQGWNLEFDPPEWMQPGEVYLTGICALLFSQMNHPSIEGEDDSPCMANVLIETGNTIRATDYRIDEDKTIAWREAIAGDDAETGALFVDPSLYALFTPIAELGGGDAFFVLKTRGDRLKRPLLVQLHKLPNFVGAIMELRPFPLFDMPDWAEVPPPAEEPSV